MEAKKRAAVATPTKYQGKCNDNSRIISRIKNIFLSGQRVTARQLNELSGGNDARKYISDLRKEGWKITDMWNGLGSKIYWLVSEDRQFNIFQEGGEA